MPLYKRRCDPNASHFIMYITATRYQERISNCDDIPEEDKSVREKVLAM